MSKLTVLEFEKEKLPDYDIMYQELRTIICSKYGHFSFVEIVGILEALKLEFVHKSLIRPE